MASLRTGAFVASLMLAIVACDEEDDPTGWYGGPSTPGVPGGTSAGTTGGATTGGAAGGSTTGGIGMGMPGPGGTTSGSTAGNTGGSTAGNTGGATAGNTGGSTAGNTGGATAGSTGGSTAGNTGGSTGGSTAGNTGGSTAGNTGGSTAGNTGGSTAGNTGGGGPLTAACEAPAEKLPADVALPIVFVHGFAGSAQQYESQAMRFIANGYPADRIYALDHDGEGSDFQLYADQVDALVEKARKDHNAEQVYLVGHSRGTIVSLFYYLWDPERVTKVAKYISLDGAGCVLPGVPCLEPSQATLPGQAHVEVATSAESFKAQYEFLVGKPPTVVDLVAQKAPIEISGRAVNFPANTGRAGAKLEIWSLDSATGNRVGTTPLSSITVPESGDFGPVVVEPTKHYELVLIGTDGSNHHFYPQPFLRCDKFVRLLSGPSDSPSRMNTNRGPDHVAAVAMRMREWQQTDVLEIKTTRPSGEQPVVNGIGSTVADAIAVFLHDDTTTPKMSSRAELTAVTGPFQTGVDVYMPAATPTDGTVTFTNFPRGDRMSPQVIRTPNWASDKHLITVMFSDFPQK